MELSEDLRQKTVDSNKQLQVKGQYITTHMWFYHQRELGLLLLSNRTRLSMNSFTVESL